MGVESKGRRDRRSFRHNSRAASGLTYGFMVGLVAVIAIGAIGSTGNGLRSIFGEVAPALVGGEACGAGSLDGIGHGSIPHRDSVQAVTQSPSASPPAGSTQSEDRVTLRCLDGVVTQVGSPRAVALACQTPAYLPDPEDGACVGNAPPNLSAPGDQITAEDTAITGLVITLSDDNTPSADLDLLIGSDNQTLIPDANLTLGPNTNGTRLLDITPVAQLSGSAVITLTATDDQGLTATAGFTVTVTAENDAPVIAPVGDQTTDEDVALADLLITLSDVETQGDLIGLAAASSNQALVADGSISIVADAGGERRLTLTPMADQFGTTTITLTATDGDGLTSTEAFDLTVQPVNDAPHLVACTPGFTVARLSTTQVDAAACFQDVDGDPVTLAASAPFAGQTSVTVSGSSLNAIDVTGTTSGAAGFQVRAQDDQGGVSPYVTVNGTVTATCVSGSQTFTFSGSVDTFTVPEDCTSISVVMWGAGGGAAVDTSGTNSGGAGGAAEATVPVTSLETLNVVVGEGGGPRTGPGAFGGGGRKDGDDRDAQGSRGGGMSGLFRGTAMDTAHPEYALVIAGGGGGNARISGGLRAGAGGGLEGQDIEPPISTCALNNGGHGGTQTAGGAAPVRNPANGNLVEGEAGSQFQGGAAYAVEDQGNGSGGGGWYGGSAGTDCADTGGGGGSGYLNGAAGVNGDLYAGNYTTPGLASDTRRTTVGAGLAVGATGTAQGGHGLVIITW